MSRLRLDWALSTSAERSAFLNKYISTLGFTPTNEELELMGNYVLWGRGANGKNAEEDGDVSLPRKRETWTDVPLVSLDEITETPNVTPARTLRPLSEPPLRLPHRKISREEVRQRATPDLLAAFETLWEQIDALELELNFYDLAHGKRRNEPRTELLARFSPDEIVRLRDAGAHLLYYNYLKKRHLLVELRREQYTLRDSFAPVSFAPNTAPEEVAEELPLTFDADVPVLPLGLYSTKGIAALVYAEPITPTFSQSQLRQISQFLREKRTILRNCAAHHPSIDFRDPNVIATIALNYTQLSDAAATPFDNSIYSTTQQLLDTFDFYTRAAQLNETQREILRQKQQNRKNAAIAHSINQQFNKTYGENYISTIFRQKICPKIAAAAQRHYDLIEEIFFPENWKKCTNCGRWLLRDEVNFMHRKGSRDGFAGQCKICDKEKRKRKKEE